jgi:hypothetical protein
MPIFPVAMTIAICVKRARRKSIVTQVRLLVFGLSGICSWDQEVCGKCAASFDSGVVSLTCVALAVLTPSASLLTHQK